MMFYRKMRLMPCLAALSSGEMDAEELKKEDTQKKVRAYDFKGQYVSPKIIFELNPDS